MSRRDVRERLREALEVEALVTEVLVAEQHRAQGPGPGSAVEPQMWQGVSGRLAARMEPRYLNWCLHLMEPDARGRVKGHGVEGSPNCWNTVLP